MDRPGPGVFGCSGDNVDVCIVPGVGNEIENAPCGNNPAYSGNFTAHGGIDLSSINNGGPANGTWQLFAADLAGGDVGSIISWSLEFQTSVQTVQTAGLPSGSAFPVGITVNTFRSTDAYGNVSQCSFDVQVLDAEPPVWVCPADLYVATDPGRCDAVVNFSVPAVTDNCPGVSVVQTGGLLSGDVFPLGTTSIIFEASDASGNTSLCVFDIIVEDTEDPIITCPFDIITLTPQGTCEATVFFNDATATDNCSNPAVVQASGLPSGVVFPVGNSVVSFQATDDAGNTASCSFNITVNDAETPVISCPQSFTVTNDIGDCGSIVLFANATATDNCPGVDVIQTAGPTSGSVFPVGITTVAFRATDASGNTAVCSFTITVLDTESPQITCPSNITVTNDPGLCGAVITYQVITTDNCPGETLVQTSGLASGSAFPVGSILNAFRVTDASGNQGTCSFTVTVNPNPVPVADAGPDVAICQGGNATLTASGGIAYEWSHGDTTAITTVAPAQTTTYTVTVTNVNGCTASDNVTVTVNSLPSVSFTPLNPIYCVDGPAVTLTGTPPGGTFSGNGVSGNSFSPAAAGKGTATITYTYTDSNGCTGSQTQATEVEVCIGMAAIASSEIHVYPNPFEHRIHISIVSHIKQNMLIRMTDLNGKEVYRASVKLEKGNNLIDIAHDSMLADALYILELTTNNGSNIYRLIKQRQ
jgi:VCBS repeat-containing protein